MKKWEISSDDLYYNDLVCLTIREEGKEDRFVLGYEAKFYDEKDTEYAGIKFITELKDEIRNINMHDWFGCIDKGFPEHIEIVNNGEWYIYTNPNIR